MSSGLVGSAMLTKSSLNLRDSVTEATIAGDGTETELRVSDPSYSEAASAFYSNSMTLLSTTSLFLLRLTMEDPGKTINYGIRCLRLVKVNVRIK